MQVKRFINKAFLTDMTRDLFLYETAFFGRYLLLKYAQGSFRKYSLGDV